MIMLLIIGIALILSVSFRSHRHRYYSDYNPYYHQPPVQTVIQTPQRYDDWHYQRYREERSNALLGSLVFVLILFAVVYFFSNEPPTEGYQQRQTSTGYYSHK